METNPIRLPCDSSPGTTHPVSNKANRLPSIQRKKTAELAQPLSELSTFDPETSTEHDSFFQTLNPSLEKASRPGTSNVSGLWNQSFLATTAHAIDLTKPVSEAPITRPAGEAVLMSPSEIVPISQDLLTRQLATQTHDNLAFANQFLDFMAKHPEISPQQAIRIRTPDSMAAIAKYGGAHCAGQSMHMVASLRKHGIPAYIVPSNLHEPPPMLTYAHAAAVVKFKDPATSKTGYVLLDPGNNFPKAVVLTPGETTSIKLGKNDWTFSINGDGNLISKQMQQNSVQEGIFYLSLEWMNPDKALTITGISGIPRNSGKYFIGARDANGITTDAIRVYLKEQTVILGVGDHKRTYTLDQVDDQVKQNFTPEFAQQFGATPEFLFNRITQAINNREILFAAESPPDKHQ